VAFFCVGVKDIGLFGSFLDQNDIVKPQPRYPMQCLCSSVTCRIVSYRCWRRRLEASMSTSL